MVGGYYDAGDNVKFGFPMAFTVTMLSWGVLEYGKEIMEAGEYDHALEAIKWGTDFFIKAHTHPTVLWVQVSDILFFVFQSFYSILSMKLDSIFIFYLWIINNFLFSYPIISNLNREIKLILQLMNC